MIINLSNHPSEGWQEKQRAAARCYGEIVDMPFPVIPAESGEGDIASFVRDYLGRIEALRPDAVFLMGEYTFVYMMAGELEERGIPALSSSSERIVTERTMEDGAIEKSTRFDFVRFRRYTRYRTPILGITKNGIVVRDRYTSHLHDLGENGKALLHEAIREVSFGCEEGKKKTFTRDFGVVIGFSKCVPKEAYRGEIVYVYRKNREGVTPMVKNTDPVPSGKLTFSLLGVGKEEAVLVTAYIGDEAPREPWDIHIETEEEKRISESFWRSHALVYEESEIDFMRS